MPIVPEIASIQRVHEDGRWRVTVAWKNGQTATANVRSKTEADTIADIQALNHECSAWKRGDTVSLMFPERCAAAAAAWTRCNLPAWCLEFQNVQEVAENS